MAKSERAKHNLPGTIYKNGNRWWWKVKLPGEDKITPRPLKPVGSNQAAKDYSIAMECAKILFAQAVFKSGQKTTTGNITNIAELTKAYTEYADVYYKGYNNIPSNEPDNIRYVLNPLIEMFASIEIEEFGPLKLMEFREELIKKNFCRKSINKRIGVVKRMFKWASRQQLIPTMIYQSLLTVDGLRRGRCAAKEIKRVKAVDEKHVYAILPYTSPVLSAMIQIQLLTGMRPTEMLLMKPKDIDRSGEVWHYYPERHKNEFREQDRVVPIGPRAQTILSSFLLRNEDEYCFSPTESEKFRRGKLTQNRQTPLSCGNTVGSNRKDNPLRSPGEVYDYKTYGKAVSRAIAAARKAIKDRKGDPDKELPKWTPYQLRHSAGVKTQKMFNYETVGAVLGHTNLSATAIYTERNQKLADEAAKKIG